MSIQREQMGIRYVARPLVAVVSVLERAATLIESGVNPGKALRQVARELVEYQEAHAGELIPERSLSDELGRPQKRAA